MARKIPIPKDLKRDEILALDIAEHCGFHSVCDSGVWTFTESKSRNNNKKHKHFRDTLIEFIQTNGIRMVVAEDINVKGYFKSMVSLAELRGILMEVCDELNLPAPEFLNVTSIKVFATGKGKASKEEMMEACVKRFNFTPLSHDQADAFHVFNYFCRKFKVK